MIRSVVRIVVLVLVSAAVGIGYAKYQGKPLVPDLVKIEQQKTERELWVEATKISLDDFVQHFQTGGLVIDARKRDVFEEGHLDAPLIMNIPADEGDYHLGRVEPYRGQAIVLYCTSETCEDAETLWKLLNSVGYSYEVRVYQPGWDGIVAAHLPVAKGPDPYGHPAVEPGATPGGSEGSTPPNEAGGP